ncbi:MAG: hypothetical protein KC422_24530, partial [Trueperaceae bacterium]|nr:hypothetical protein [Trueperaceae bacterium]
MNISAQQQRQAAGELKNERVFNHSSLFVTLFACVLLLLGFGFKAYRFTLPTEGWSLNLDFSRGLIFDQNLLGVPSPFQKGDVLLEVAGSDTFNDFNPQVSPAARAAY